MPEQMQPNPLIEGENYFDGYNKSAEGLKNNPEVILFDKLCYEVFEATEMGRKFLEFAKERFFIYSQITRGNPSYQTDLVWQEGFRDAYRMILSHIISHQQRIKAGENKA